MIFQPILRLAASFAFAGAFAVSAAEGADVTLTSRSGGLTIAGELLPSKAGSFVIKSGFGVITVEASKFDCTGAACPKPAAGTLAIHGSNTIGAQLMPDTIEAFGEKEGYTLEKIVGADPEQVTYKLYGSDGKEAGTIDLQSHGSNTAPPDLLQGKAQIGAMSRPIKPEEVKAITDSGTELKTHVFALDGVVVLVSPQNTINALSLDQIAKIFAGATGDWSEVGGSPGKIKLYGRDAKSGTYDTFNNLVLKPGNLKISAEAKRFESSPELSDETAHDPNGIGFVGFAYVRNAKALAISSACGIVSPPQVFSVKTEEYPLSRRLFLHSTGFLSPLGSRLLDYALSDGVQDTVSGAGFVNQRIDLQSFEQQAARLAPALLVPDKEFKYAYMRDLVNDLRNARRLSVNFHFPKNSAALDDKARQDIPRLATFLKNDGAKFKEILLAGFTDNTGTFDGNRAVAFARATAFKNALTAEGVPAGQIIVKSYGSLLPAGCNATEAGKEKNRRVEVWVKE
ncbi:MAG: phosphate ABC transporter substrate-binding/OmpA family protein [Rhodomicrobium sp.]